jgi:DNA adenine methylase
MAVSSPIKRHGGKAYMATDIRKLFPKHTRYVEPFFGSGAVMLAGDGEGVAEYANDLDDDLWNFWAVLRDERRFERFARCVNTTPFAEKSFKLAKDALSFTGTTDVEERSHRRAVAFFVVNRQSRQALGKDFATPTSRLRRGMNEQVSAWLTAVEGLPAFHDRLKRVEVRCEPAVSLIKKLDLPETLFYCDPPYVHDTRSTTGEYKHEMTTEDHKELLETLAKIKGKFILSGYGCDLYHDFAQEHGWACDEFDLPNNASSAGTKERKREFIWRNYK